MKIRLLAFGIAREIINDQSILFELQNGKTVSVLKSELIKQYPAFNDLSHFSIAVNENYADDNDIISENDEIAIIPPVSGG